MEKKERLYWNLVKGAAIFLMIWGHCIQYCALEAFDYFENSVFKAIYTFHMPVLMLVSGYLFYYSFQKRELKDLLIHRIQGMLQPIVFATILNNILVLVPQFVLSNRLDVLYGKLFEGIDYVYWFLWTVLFSSITVGVICKAVKNPLLQILLVSAGMLLVGLYPQWEMCLFMYPYFAAGFFAGMYRKAAETVFRRLKYAAFVIFPVMVCFYETKHYIYITPIHTAGSAWHTNLGLNLFRYAIGFVGILALLGFMELIVKTAAGKDNLRRPLKGLSWLGENSLAVYCLSVPLLSVYLPAAYTKLMSVAGGNFFARSMVIYNYVFTPALSVLFAAGIFVVVCFLRRTGVHKLIFGR